MGIFLYFFMFRNVFNFFVLIMNGKALSADIFMWLMSSPLAFRPNQIFASLNLLFARDPSTKELQGLLMDSSVFDRIGVPGLTLSISDLVLLMFSSTQEHSQVKESNW
ncbi:hypothetical protein ACP275_05G000800 [Erythranthe tilingii]